MKIGLIGLGRWGSIWARVLQEKNVLCWATDVNPSKEEVCPDYWLPYLVVCENLPSSSIDGVILATPPRTHFTWVKAFLEQEIPVLCEKPFTLNSNEARELEALSKETLTPIVMGHTFLHSEPIRVAAEYGTKIGEIQKINCRWLQNGTRSNLGLNSLWNLGPHPASIIRSFLQGKPVENIKTVIDGDFYNSEFICDDVEVQLSVSHDHAHIVREVKIIGEEGTVTCLPNEGKVIVLGDEKRYDIKVEGREPLKNELDWFMEVIRDYSSMGYFYGQDGCWIVDLLERIEPYDE